jgi:hypothetical protein
MSVIALIAVGSCLTGELRLDGGGPVTGGTNLSSRGRATD